jgi:hypothetical protein
MAIDFPGKLATNADGSFRTTSQGLFTTGIGQEIDFFDRASPKDAYDGTNRDISDLWVGETHPDATTGAKVFHTEGYNIDGSLTPHSAASLPRSQYDNQFDYLPQYPEPGDRMSLDIFFTQNKSNCKTQFHFGVGGEAPEYGNHLLIGLDNTRGGLILGRETEVRGGYIVYDEIPYEFDLDTKYSPVIQWHLDGHFTVYFRGRQATTRGAVNSVPVAGYGIGYEVSSGNINHIDSVRLV